MENKMEGVGVPVAVSGVVESVGPSLSSPENRVEALRRVSVFADLPDEQLQWFADHTEERRFHPGEILFRRGEPAVWMTIYLEGEIHGSSPAARLRVARIAGVKVLSSTFASPHSTSVNRRCSKSISDRNKRTSSSPPFRKPPPEALACCSRLRTLDSRV